jgi:dTDP-4-amino-4,6-dideoxygalactose transaminase
MRALAIEGGTPAFADPLHVGRPNLGDRTSFQARVDRLLDDRWFTNGGPLVAEFEASIAEHLGVDHCVATCNGTLALQLTLRALDLTGEVIVTPATFVATAHAIQWEGLTPVFCDVDPRTHNLDPAAVEAAVTERTSAIVGVHLWGRPCATRALEDIADRHGLRLVFDAAHAFSCSSEGTMIGTFGDAEVLSFHATKFVHSFEGGAVVTEDSDLADRLRLLRNFGFADYDQVALLGTNAKLPEIAAAMGLCSLEAMEQFRTANETNLAAYIEALAGVPGLSLVAYDERERSNRHYVVALVEPDGPLQRDELHTVLWAERILARRYFTPGCHRMEPYRSLDPLAAARLPNAEALLARTLVLPTGQATSLDDVDVVCDVIRTAMGRPDAVRARLQG